MTQTAWASLTEPARTVRQFLADFAVQYIHYVTNEAMAKLYVM